MPDLLGWSSSAGASDPQRPASPGSWLLVTEEMAGLQFPRFVLVRQTVWGLALRILLVNSVVLGSVSRKGKWPLMSKQSGVISQKRTPRGLFCPLRYSHCVPASPNTFSAV